ncbi:lysozyme inhibitor LprI family protein [Lysobacter claricitrinus]|uniref:lysozyme inhibitor LprI family protein n=1 Tax=Lysobacter claricitrinus TaxID=3367728 RepID=UPI0037DA9BAD
MEQAFLVVLGAALTWAFYFIQRRVERRRTTEAIERSQKLLTLKQGLEGSKTSLGDLQRFEAGLVGKAQSAVEIADGYLARAEEVIERGAIDVLRDDEFTAQARERLLFADARLHRVVARLREQLDGEGQTAFDRTHAAWLQFRDRHALFIAQSYARGPIRALIQAVTLESLTAAWIAELETQLGE